MEPKFDKRHDVGMLEFDQLLELMLIPHVICVRFIGLEDLIELDRANAIPTLIQRRPHNSLPADTDLLEQCVLAKGGSRCKRD